VGRYSTKTVEYDYINLSVSTSSLEVRYLPDCTVLLRYSLSIQQKVNISHESPNIFIPHQA